MHRIISRKTLRDFTVTGFPYISTDKERRKLHRNVFKVAYPENFEQKIVKTSDLELI